METDIRLFFAPDAGAGSMHCRHIFYMILLSQKTSPIVYILREERREQG